MALCHWEYVNASGIVGVDADGLITRFLEEPSPEQVFSHWINASIYVLEPHVLDAIPPGRFYDFGRDRFPALLDRGDPLYGYQMGEGERLWLIDTQRYLEQVERGLNAGGEFTSFQPRVLNLPR
ncbi:MAG: NDP-sugar synthase [Chloroflexi bacterium]|nr:NDP-sugar synthase [Chloroflexota bacterium]